MEAKHALVMEPNEVLCFQFIPNTNVTSTIYLKNNSKSNISYKIKTTAPKAFYVRPNQGVLAPDDQKEVNVIMQNLPKYQGSVNYKFLVQHALTNLTPSSSTTEITKFWETISTQDITSARLRVEIIEKEDKNTLPASPPSIINILNEPDMTIEADALSKNSNLTKYVVMTAIGFVVICAYFFINR